MPGPAPKHDPIRRNARSGPVKLPAEGRKGLTPQWPLPDPPSSVETEAWVELWKTPQSVAWERLGWTRTVARYCRMMCEAEQADAPATVRAETRQMEDRLGLTPKSMRMLLWEIVDNEVAEKRDESKTEDPRKRFKAVG